MVTRAKRFALNGKWMHAPGTQVRCETAAVLPGDEAAFTENIHRREYIIPTVFRAMVILKILDARDRGITVAEIHEQTGFAKTTIYRILRTLSFSKMLRQDVQGKYWACTKDLPLRDSAAARNMALEER